MANGLFVADIPGAVQRGLQFRQAAQLRPVQQRSAELGLQQKQQALQLGGLQQQRTKQLIGSEADAIKRASIINAALNIEKLGDNEIIPFLQSEIQNARSSGRDLPELEPVLELARSGDIAKVRSGAKNIVEVGVRQGIIKAPSQRPAGQVEFEALTKGLPEEQKLEARLVKLGLSARAVGSAIQTISDKGIAEQIGKASATIKQREKFGELSGSSRAKAIDSGIERISKIDVGLANIDRAISALNAGAGVGAIERFLPSFKAASVSLDNIQKSMALDVIGAVTFGALSEGELNLAKEVALPTGLDTDALIQHLSERKAAQQKLRDYFNEQIQFLDQGGTVAGFLREKERGTETQQTGNDLTPEEQAELAERERQFGGQ